MPSAELNIGRHIVAAPDSPDRSAAFPVLKTLLFTLLVPGSVAVYLPYAILEFRRQLRVDRIGPWQVLAALPAALGVAGYLWCACDFAVAGRGTPAPIDPPKILVARGLYRFVRNPMYASVLLVLLGESLFFESLALVEYALVFWAATSLFVLLYEEPALRRKFGGSYEEYCRTVPRWIPRRPGRGGKGSGDAL